jgi:hypothetical protein
VHRRAHRPRRHAALGRATPHVYTLPY